MHTCLKSILVPAAVLLYASGAVLAQAPSSADTDALRALMIGCGGGATMDIDGTLELQIVGEYINGTARGSSFVAQNLGLLFQQLPQGDRTAAFEIFTGCMENGMERLWPDTQSYAPGYPEPSEMQMRQALDRALRERGTSSRNGGHSVEFLTSGIQLDILEFRKSDCRVALYGAGYDCTYLIRTGVNYYSTEGSYDGHRHAEAVNTLLGLFGGNASPLETATRRFVRDTSGWVASDG